MGWDRGGPDAVRPTQLHVDRDDRHVQRHSQHRHVHQHEDARRELHVCRAASRDTTRISYVVTSNRVQTAERRQRLTLRSNSLALTRQPTLGSARG